MDSMCHTGGVIWIARSRPGGGPKFRITLENRGFMYYLPPKTPFGHGRLAWTRVEAEKFRRNLGKILALR